MKNFNKLILIGLLFLALGFLVACNKNQDITESSIPDKSPNLEENYSDIIKDIAEEINLLKSKLPELEDFQIDKNVDLENLQIDYAFKTHDSQSQVGWTAGVPEPDNDGIWFYINIHDPDSMAQIDTQPGGISLCLKSKRVTFLMLKGRKTKIGGEIDEILKKHGVVECN